jgi:hypothetical protein
VFCSRIVPLRLYQPLGRRAQVSLELAASFITMLILLFGSIQVFLWVNKQLVTRQQDYEATRVAADGGAELQVDESSYPKLDILGK